MADRDTELAKLCDLVQTMEAALAHKNAQLAHKDAQLAELSSQLVQRDSENARLRSGLESVQALLGQVLQVS